MDISQIKASNDALRNLTEPGSFTNQVDADMRDAVATELASRGIKHVANLAALADISRAEAALIYVIDSKKLFEYRETGEVDNSEVFAAAVAGFWHKVPLGNVESVNGKIGAVTVNKTDVGLSDVENTADLDKPISTATQTALDAKADETHGHIIADVTGLQAALDSKNNGAVASDLVGTVWNLDTDPIKELPTLAANAVITTTGTSKKARGVLFVNNPGTFTISIDGVNIPINNNGFTAITMFYLATRRHFSTDLNAASNFSYAVPDAPTNGIVDNNADTFAFTETPGYTVGAGDYEYSVNDAAYTPVTANPIVVGAILVPVGKLKVRVKSNATRLASADLTNSAAFTVGILDSFTGADTTTILAHSLDSGGAWTRAEGTATPTIVSNKLKSAIHAAAAQGFITETSKANNVVLTLDVIFNNGSITGYAGIIFRASDGSNLWYCHVGHGRMSVNKRVSGSSDVDVIGSSVAYNAGVTYQLKVELTDNLIKFTFNNQIVQYTDAFNNTATQAGIRVYSGNAVDFVTVDNFSVV